jgi:hypothetical protein
MSSRAKFNQVVSDFVRESEDVLKKYVRREITKEVWLQATAELVYKYHIQAANVGRNFALGSDDLISPQDYEIGGGFAFDQQPFLSDFYNAIQDYTEEDARERLLLYQFNLRGTANSAWLDALNEVETRWVTTANESCVDCLYNASLGYMPARDWPISPGSIGLECAMSCRCYFRLRNGKTGLKYVKIE